MVSDQADIATPTGERRYRHLFEHAPICIFVIDLTVNPPTIQEINRQAELVYGYPAAELVGMPAAHLVPEEALPVILTTVQRVQQGQTVTTETSSRHRDGTRFSVRMIATPDPADSGHMIVTVEDITVDKQRRSEAEAIDAERRRIAHEIHDGVAQSLAGLRFKTALWSHLADAQPAGMRTAVDEMQTVLTDAIADLRRAIFALRPLDLEAVGFYPALTQLVADFGDQHPFSARLNVSGPQDILPIAYELPLFRIVQQGLNNIDQHARASSVLVRLDLDPTRGIAVSVRDDGRGFDPSQLGAATRADHFGLRQMRERILALGGTLDIHSTLGQGTELRITLPPAAKEVNHAAD